MVIGAFAARAAIGAALGAGIELGMQTGKQVLGQMKDNWDSDRDLTDIKWKCIDINWKHVGASAAIGTVAPGMLSTGKTVVQSAKAIRTLSGQAANTANRAAKLAARKAAHADTIKKAVAAGRLADGQADRQMPAEGRRGVPAAMIKHYLLMTLVCIPLALLYVCLEWFFGNTWVTVGVFFGVLVVLRLGLYLYRRSKGIRDGYLDE